MMSDFEMPIGACDCHVHVIGPYAQYPMVNDRVYTPPECGAGKLKTYLQQHQLSRVVLIQPSFYGSDNTYQLLVTQEMGGCARAVVVIDQNTGDEELDRMVSMGAQGVRMNLSTAGMNDPEIAGQQLVQLADRIKDFGLHIQIYSTPKIFASIAKIIYSLPVPVVFDHFASVKAAGFQASPELPIILDLLKSGQLYIKLSGVYRISDAEPDYAEVKELAQRYVDTNPDRILWASDWPHTNTIPGIPATQITPYRVVDDHKILQLLAEWIPNPHDRNKVLASNAERLYRF